MTKGKTKTNKAAVCAWCVDAVGGKYVKKSTKRKTGVTSMTTEEARGLAAQAWTSAKNTGKQMDPDLAEEFAEILLKQEAAVDARYCEKLKAMSDRGRGPDEIPGPVLYLEAKLAAANRLRLDACWSIAAAARLVEDKLEKSADTDRLGELLKNASDRLLEIGSDLPEQAPPPPGVPDAGTDARFVKSIKNAINANSKENGSDTPDFILANYMADCLRAFDKCSRAREKWYGKSLAISGDVEAG